MRPVLLLAAVFLSALPSCKEDELRAQFENRERNLKDSLEKAKKGAEEARLARNIAETRLVGRYQVVNGRPSAARDIMLLDTVTGKTWIYCRDTKAESDGWCQMFGGPALF